MNPLTQAVILSASTLRMIPHIILYMANRSKIAPDLEKYSADGCGIGAFIKVCTRQRVFRNLFYYRLGEYVSVFIKWMLPPDPTLHIWCPSIGPGAHFEHNYATYLNAERIGSNFYCLQLVTLGNDGKMQRPIIGDNVKIFTGATVFGGITIGNHVTIGAGAVVSKNVPDNCTVVGNPAYIVKKDGQNCKIEL
ncbi:serine O-acetyltransferase [Prevotella sp. khp1]|uniref:serine acetyltransferase n=1 Tax=Prevotellaceae TaxID=171552 RepID=UPI0008867517|nr:MULTISPECIES: serine acetyltransferase [Prevotellaceae]QVJ79589.1 serine acetyltransferase [Xylanibacter ruminicola]SDQ34078.1 serine O-acetyltransferase [Prevotella sp. khp1]